MSTVNTVKHAHKNISFAASGDNTAIEGVADQLIDVHALALTFASYVDVTLKDGDTVLGTFLNVTALVLDELPCMGRRFLCGEGNDFTVNLSSAVACKGTVWYSQRVNG